MDRSRHARGPTHPGPGSSGADEGPSSLAGTLQALQRSAGNRAVGVLLGLESAGGAPQNVPGSRVIVPGVGTIPIESVQLGRLKPGKEGEEKPEGSELPGGEVYLTSKQGAHSAKLARAVVDGTAVDVEVIIVSSGGKVFRLLLEGALVSSYTLGSGGPEVVESWSLDFESMTQSIDDEATP